MPYGLRVKRHRAAGAALIEKADALMILLLIQVSAAALFLILAGVALRGV